MSQSRAQTATIPREKRFFTLAEANATMPLVKRIVADITESYRELVRQRERVAALREEGRSEMAEAVMDESDPLLERLNDLVEELAEVGAQLKDWDKGLIDFPAIHEGREVLLCWHAGEDAIEFWHETDAGFAGRQHVDVLSPRARGDEADQPDDE